MSWLCIDDGFHANPTILTIGDEAAGTFVRACSYCADHLTDGWVPEVWIKVNTKMRIRLILSKHKLWRTVREGDEFEVESKGDKGRLEIVTVVMPGPGAFIPDYLAFNPTKERVKLRRRARSEGGKKGADARWHQEEDDGSSHSSSHDLGDDSSHRLGDGKSMGISQSQSQSPVISLTQSVVRPLAPDLEHAVLQLVTALKDKDKGTEGVIRSLVWKQSLSVGDLVAARETAQGPNIESMSKAAVAELKKRGNPRAA